MKRDERPVMEQVKSGFLIVGKFLAAFCIAGTFMTGCGLIQTPGYWHHIAIGWLLIIVSIVVMAKTVRFWAAGFVGFIAYGALRFLGGILFARSLHVSTLYMFGLSASFFAMSILCIRFASNERPITPIDRASVVLAASCVLVAVPLMDTYKSVAVLNVGNVALFLSWWAARTSRHNRHSAHPTAASP